jgi:hypothetical protein
LLHSGIIRDARQAPGGGAAPRADVNAAISTHADFRQTVHFLH